MAKSSAFCMEQFLVGLGKAIALGALVMAGLTHAQTGPVKLMVGFPAGGGTDAIARVLADKLKDQLGVSVVVDNKAGAGGQIAAQALKVAPADGNTLFLSHDHTISILPLVVKSPGFDPARDFVPVAGFATFVNALAVSGGTPPRPWPSTSRGCRSRAWAKARWVSLRLRQCQSFWWR